MLRLRPLMPSLLTTLVFLALSGCNGEGDSKGAGSDPEGGGSVTSSLPDSLSYEAFGGRLSAEDLESATANVDTKVNAVINSLSSTGLSAQELANQIAAALSSDLTLKSVLVNPRDFTVTAQLADGTPYSIFTRFNTDGTPRKLTKNGTLREAQKFAQSMAFSLPKNFKLIEKAIAADLGDPVLPVGNVAALVNNFPDTEVHQQTTSDLVSLFSGLGYTAKAPAGTVHGLKNMGDIDVLWFDSHGVFVDFIPAPGMPKQTMYALVLGEAFKKCADDTPESCAEKREEMKKLTIGYGKSASSANPVWYINERFVQQYIKFKSKQSLVFIDACDSGSSGPEAQAMRTAFETAGAGQIYGWDGQVYAGFGGRAVKEFFDLSLGNNQYYKETIPFRPFMVNDVYGYLEKKGRFADDTPADANHAAGSAKLILFQPVPMSWGLVLRPSIQSSTVYEENPKDGKPSKIQVNGYFGDGPGKLYVNGQELNAVEWKPWTLRAEIPNVGNGYAGPVVAVTQAGVRSASVPLTAWTGTLSRNVRVSSRFGAPGIDYSTQCMLSMRGDVHLFRANINATPMRANLGYLTLVQIPDAQAGSCSWTVSGEGRKGTDVTLVAVAAGAKTNLSPPDDFNFVFFNQFGGGFKTAAFDHSAPGEYKTYDKNGKLTTQGSYSPSFNSSFLTQFPPTMDSDFRVNYNQAGQIGPSSEDQGNISIQLTPWAAPTPEPGA